MNQNENQNKPLFLFVGKSASGKTTIANKFSESNNMKQVESYTTRLPRYPNEIGHTFITEEEFKQLPDLAAYTFYNGNHYGTTFEQLSKCDIYVVDVPGVKTLLNHVDKINRTILIMYFNTDITTRINRMKERHDSDSDIVTRLLNDESNDWYADLKKVVWEHVNIHNNRNIDLFEINANGTLTNTIDQINYYTEQFMGD